MSLNGMTGFGRADGVAGALVWRWEVRSVNGKGLDARLRLPGGHERLEPAAREMIRKTFARGSIQANLQLRQDASQAQPAVNEDALNALLDAAGPLIESGKVAKPRLDGLLGLPGMLLSAEESDDEEALKALDSTLLDGLKTALAELAEGRAGEGAALKTVLLDHLSSVDTLAENAARSAGAQPAAIRDRIKTALADLLEGDLPEERLATESAMLALKADVREELDRLTAHVEAARELIEKGSPCGRKLDFQIQELMREANTLCSKSADMELTRIGLDLKAVVDQMKEQTANVE